MKQFFILRTGWQRVGLIVIPMGAALLLYAPVLKLPLIYDTLLHIRITGELDWRTVWLPTSSFGFYRPLTFVPLLLIQELFGGYPPWLLQGLNWGQHGINVFLLSSLSLRLWPDRPWQAMLTGLLFALFPFSYQAVAVYGHNVHPTTAGLLLLGLHLYLWAESGEGGGRKRWLGVGAVFGLGLLSHESAILFGGLAGLVVVGRWLLVAGDFRRLGGEVWRSPWLFFLVLGVGYFVLYQFLPISRAPQAAAASFAAWLLKGLYVGQAAAYPFTWLAHFFPSAWGSGVVLLGAAATLLLTILAWRLPHNRPVLLLGWGWWAAASLVITLPLSADYLLHGPRLLYLSAIGLAIAWGGIIGGSSPLAPSQPRLLPYLLLALILIPNWLFVRARLAEYARLTGGVQVVAEVMAAIPSEDGLVLINLPQWLGQPRYTYPIGAELTQMLGDYLFAEELMAHNLGVDHPVLAVVVPELGQTANYQFAWHEQHSLSQLAQWPAAATHHFFLTRYEADGPVMVYLGYSMAQDAAATPIASFTLYDLLDAEALACDHKVTARLVWRGRADIPPTTSIFVQLLDPAGHLIAQADGPPLSLRSDLWPWRGRDLVDMRSIGVPEGGQAAYLAVGVYDYRHGNRLTGVDADMRLLPDNALLIPITPCP